MQLSLEPHPATPPRVPELKLWVDVAHAHVLGAAATTKIWFCVSAPMQRFVVPEIAAQPSRADELWRTSCFEMFLKREGEARYREWNFSPSGEWAAYDFAAYRDGGADAEVAFAPEISVHDNLTWWQLAVTVAVEEGPWMLGLSAVLEEQGGTKSYWALAHPPGDTPDFHAPDCFAARLA